MGFVWGGVGRVLVQFMCFSALFAKWAVATLRSAGRDVVTVKGVAASSLPQGQSWPVSKTRNDRFCQ